MNKAATLPLLCKFPTCPSCDHEVTTDEAMNLSEDLFALAPDEGRASINCPSCGVEFHIQGGYVPTYTCALNEDDL